jgi:hypothetical protein
VTAGPENSGGIPRKPAELGRVGCPRKNGGGCTPPLRGGGIEGNELVGLDICGPGNICGNVAKDPVFSAKGDAAAEGFGIVGLPPA